MARSVRLPFRNGRDLQVTLTRPSRGDGSMPTVSLASVVDDGVSVLATQMLAVDGNVSTFEGLVLGALVASRRPDRIFELGTFDGRSTLILAANAPEAHVFTLDLPAADIEDAALEIGAGDVRYIAKEKIGARIPASIHASRITTLEGDSATFDYGPYEGTIDFVFVDACHEYDYVLSDSRAAIRLLGASGGAIAWHDYSVWTGVTQALNELRSNGVMPQLRRIEGTTLVFAEIPPA